MRILGLHRKVKSPVITVIYIYVSSNIGQDVLLGPFLMSGGLDLKKLKVL